MFASRALRATLAMAPLLLLTGPSEARAAEPAWVVVSTDTGTEDLCGVGLTPTMWGATEYAAWAQAMRQKVAPFHLRIGETAPDGVAADVVFMTHAPESPVESCANSPTDCGNANPAATLLLNTGLQPGTPPTKASRALRGLGRTWGLSLIDDPGNTTEIMGQGGVTAQFTDACLPVDTVTPDATCDGSNGTDCGDPNLANSYMRMMDVFGPAEPATEAPVVTIAAPADESEVAASFDLVLQIDDDLSPQVYDLVSTLDGGSPANLTGQVGPDITLPISDLGGGEHSISVDVTDEDGNTTTESVLVHVGPPPDGWTTSGGSSGGGSTSDGSTGGDTETDGTGSGGVASSGGGGCRLAPTGSPAALVVVLLASLGLRRRRGI